jgi:hypothetical protein
MAVAGFLRGDRWRILAPLAIFGLILAKPQLVLVGLSIGAVFAVMERHPRPAVEALIATAVGTIVYAAYNFMRFADVFDFGGEARTYDATAFGPGDLLEAFALLSISPGRGWLVYSPIVVLGAYGAWKARRNPLSIAAVAVLVATLIPYLGNPGSGLNWGSRYLVPAIPLFVALAWAAPARRWIAPLLAIVGFIVAAPTFAAFYQRSYAEHVAQGVVPEEVYWHATQAPIIDMWGAARRQVSAARHTDVIRLASEPEASPDAAGTVEGQKFFRVVAQWWWMTPAAGIPRAFGVFVAALLLIGGTWLIALTDRRCARLTATTTPPI